ncbi:Cytochrome c-type biogenesis CcmH-like mitochondrial protein [Vitis vinifera]|uniref:Cytochrome c-type biogenesis protein n=1 Tax=Vitis vinifera TaxID=29760 RepID=A0A438GB90_VITVI|nr:Cytochrome c-type biogenesis CcmH-like mitochondrial protein [Vitis vinifera]
MDCVGKRKLPKIIRGLVSFLDHFLSEAGFAPDMAINKAERNMIVQTAAYKAFLSGYFGCLKGVVLKFTSTLSATLLHLVSLFFPSTIEQEDFGESVLYTPKFDMQTAALWLSPIIFGGVAVGIWAYNRHRQKTDVHIMALNLVRGVPLTPKERETILDLVTPPPPEGATPFSWWRKWRGR